MDPRLQNRFSPRTRMQPTRLLLVMEDSRVVRKNNARDVPSPKKALQGRRREGLGLVQPPEGNSRDTGAAPLQRAQEGLHLRERVSSGRLGTGQLEVSSRPTGPSPSSPQLGSCPLPSCTPIPQALGD